MCSKCEPSVEDPVEGPPHNAPTGPASLRKATSSPRILPTAPLLSHSATPGTWSQSKRWLSTEAKERQAFQKLTFNLRYLGADKSPFLPQTPRELTVFLAESKEMQKKRLLREVARRENK